jgi:hypothetical protein
VENNDMHSQFVLPAILCVAGLIALADLWPIDIEVSADQDSDLEENLTLRKKKSAA